MARITAKKSKSKASAPTSVLGQIGHNLLQPTTIAGLLTIGASFATGGLAGWLNAETLPALLAGVGLIFAKDERSLSTMLRPSQQEPLQGGD